MKATSLKSQSSMVKKIVSPESEMALISINISITGKRRKVHK